MKHIETIEALIRALINSESFHALVVESLPGWGKSTAIDLALKQCGIKATSVGAYATPLHIFLTMSRHPSSVLILDDCAGLFSDAKSMAILKAATWYSSDQGSDTSRSATSRRVTWGSTSEKVEVSSVDFSGKLILLTNVIPSGKETEAFLSRCLSYRIKLSEDDIRQMLTAGAKSEMHFPRTDLALEIASFLISEAHAFDLMKVNLRTLRSRKKFSVRAVGSMNHSPHGRFNLIDPLERHQVLQAL